jgi:hypothetical protein
MKNENDRPHEKDHPSGRRRTEGDWRAAGLSSFHIHIKIITVQKIETFSLLSLFSSLFFWEWVRDLYIAASQHEPF